MAIICPITANASYWEQCSDFGGGNRTCFKAATVDGKIYTGLGTNDNKKIPDWWEYNTFQNKWTEKAVPPFEERHYNEVVAVGQKIYVGLGIGTNYFVDWWEYNINEDNWYEKSNFPGYNSFGRSSSSTSNNHHAYVYLKYAHEHEIWEYDPTNDSWSPITNYPGNQIAAMVASDDKIYCKGTESNEFWEYNLTTSTWNQKSDFGKVSYNQTSGIIYKDEIYIVALKYYSDTNTNAGIWKYDMVNDSWTRLSNSDYPGTGCYSSIVVASDDFIYIGMGSQESIQTSDWWRYNPTSEINTLKTYVSPDAGGIIFISASQPRYRYTENVTMQAIPYTNYVFTGWSEDSCNDDYSSCTIKMDSDQSITANFEYSTPTPLVDYQGSWQSIPMAYTVSDIHYNSEIQVQNNGDPVIAYAKNMGKTDRGFTAYAIHIARWNGDDWKGFDQSNIEYGISEESYSLGDFNLTLDSNNSAYVAWLFSGYGTNGPSKIFYSFFDSISWNNYGDSNFVITAKSNTDSLAFAIDKNKFPVIAWFEWPEDIIKLLKWDGNRWAGIGGSDAESGLSQSDNASSPFDMAVNQYDNIFVTYLDRTIGTWCTYLKYWDGSNWTGLGGSDEEGGLGIHQGYAYIALKNDGWPILAWSESHRIICKEWTGDKWIDLASNTDGTVYSGNNYCQLYGIYLTSDNYPVLCWCDGDIFSSSKEYFCKKWNGTAWTTIGNPSINYYLNQLYSNSEIKSFAVNNDHINILLRNYQSETFEVLTISPQSERLYGLSININPSLNNHFSPCASISKNPDKQLYSYGENVTLVATPGCCYEFVDWSGDATSNRLEMTITMDSDKSIIANFEKKSNNWKCGWETRASYPTEIWEHTAEVVNDKIYVIGGTDSTTVGGRKSISTVREYDPYHAKWTTKSPMNIARRNHSSEVVNNKIYVFGGFSENDDHLSSVEEYNTLTDRWTIKKNMPATRTFAGTTSIDNRIYLYGGRRNDEGSITKIMEMYDVNQNTWTTKSSLPEGIWFTDGVLINGKIHIISYDDYIVYDPDNDNWSSLPSYNEDPNFFGNCKNLLIDNKIFVINDDKFYSYDVESGQWNDKLPSLCDPRDSIAVVILDTKIYAIGGLYNYESPQTSTNTVEVFDYSDYNKPFVYDINEQTTDENLPITIPVFIGQVDHTTETDTCNLSLAFEFSELSMISHENITYTCLQNTFYISLTPITEIGGVATITITAIDDEKNLTSSTFFELTVLPVNDPPKALNVKFFTLENQIITGQLNAYDIDSPITSFSIVSNPDKGTVNITNTGEFTYTPDLNQYGEDSFSYQAYDNESASSNTAIVSIFITPMNAPPFAYGKDITIDEDKYIYITLVASDPDNDNLTYQLVNHPTHGTVSLSNDIALYTPHPDVNGPDSFTYKANDGLADSNTAKIMITVYPVYDNPQAISQDVTIMEDMPVNITLTGYSPDNYSLTFQIIDQPAHGIISQSAPNLTYTPDFHFSGEDHFTFVANDSISNSNPATVSITVKRSETYVLKLLGTGYGTVNINSTSVLLPWESPFQADQEVCFESIPDTNWQFINWTGDLNSNDNPVCIILDQNKTITANMAIKTFALTIQGSEAITINHTRQSLPFSKIYEIHTPVVIQSPSELFKCWEWDHQIFENPYLFTINTDMAITAHYYPEPDWQTSIQVERWVDNSDVVKNQSVVIGSASEAYTKSAPELPDNYSCDIVLYNQVFDAFSKDIRQNADEEYQWVIAVDPHGNIENPLILTTATIKWNPGTFSHEGQYVLKSNTTGEIVISDMRQSTEYQVTNSSYKPFTIIWNRFQTFELHLKEGWNLISLPLIPSNGALENLFPDFQAAFEYKNGGYRSVNTMVVGKGYWLKIPSQKTYSISGEPFLSYTIDFADGWHLIGTAYNEMTPDDVSIKAIFRYMNGGYEQAFALVPGFGYWIKIEE